MYKRSMYCVKCKKATDTSAYNLPLVKMGET